MKYQRRPKTSMTKGSSFVITIPKLSRNDLPKGLEIETHWRQSNDDCSGSDTAVWKARGNYHTTFPRVYIMNRNNGNGSWSYNPADNRRHSESRSSGVKWTTGHVTEDQPSRGKYATGLNSRSKSIRDCLKIGTWNVQGLVLYPGKMQIIER